MSIVYLIALAAVGVALLEATAAAVAAASSRPEWEPIAPQPALMEVLTHDRRGAAMPFVGKDRRRSTEAEATPEKMTRVA